MQETKTCQNCKKEFVIESDDFAFYEKMKVPAPSFCPLCRAERRMAWRNERSFFRNTCRKCGKNVISVYPADSGIIVYCRPCWWADGWDGLEYGADYDPSRPFLEQVRDLLYRVPLPDLFGLYSTLENSEYTNMAGYLKNCYFLTMADWDENCIYGSNVYHSKDSCDALILDESELCYEVVNCRKCYRVMFSLDCTSSQDVFFSKNLSGCSNCIGCVNLRNKQYHIFNKPYSKEEYEKASKEYLPTSRSRTERACAEARMFWARYPQKYIHERLTNSVSGDYIYNSKNARNCFMVQDMEHARFCSLVTPGGTKDSYDHTHYGGSSELLYETLQVGNQASRIIASWFTIIGVEDVEHSMWTIGSKHIFGCVGVKKREYCILNKRYDKDSFEKLRGEIVAQMNTLPYVDARGRRYGYGEFFPIEMSPFAYNVSGVQEFFPLTKEGAEERGYRWKSSEEKNYSITISHEKIPDESGGISSTITEEILGCEHEGSCAHQCSVAFRITSQELQFYKRFGLPLPKLCPNCRHYARLEMRNPYGLHARKCACAGKASTNGTYQNTTFHSHGDSSCPNEFETSYAPERPDIVYCEACYNSEVV